MQSCKNRVLHAWPSLSRIAGATQDGQAEQVKHFKRPPLNLPFSVPFVSTLIKNRKRSPTFYTDSTFQIPKKNSILLFSGSFYECFTTVITSLRIVSFLLVKIEFSLPLKTTGFGKEFRMEQSGSVPLCCHALHPKLNWPSHRRGHGVGFVSPHHCIDYKLKQSAPHQISTQKIQSIFLKKPLSFTLSLERIYIYNFVT